MRTCFTVALSIFSGITIGAVAVEGLRAQANPPAYVIGEIDVTNQEGYAKEYQPAALAALKAYGVKILSRGSKSASFQGEPPKHIVLFAFENMDKAQAAFTSSAYKEALALGTACHNSSRSGS